MSDVPDNYEEGRDNMADEILEILDRYETEGRMEDWLIKEIRKACHEQLTKPDNAKAVPSAEGRTK